MTQEQIMKLLNKKIKEATKTSEHDTEQWRYYYYSGVVKGIKDAQSVIGMLDKDISIDYPTNLLLPCDNVVKDVVDTKPQDKMVSLDKACELLKNIIDDDVLVKCGSVIKCMDIDDFVLYFRKSMEK